MNAALVSRFRLNPRAATALIGAAACGLVTFIAGLFLDPARAWSNWLLAAYYFTSLALFGTLFIAIGYLTRASWHVVLRRVPEAMSAWLPAACLTMLVLALGMGHLYEWVHPHEGGHEAHLIHHKAPYLNVGFFFVRMVVFFGIWIGISRLLSANSRRQDADGAVVHTVRNTRMSAIFAVLFALSLSLASFDWLMSLDATWFSTIFGVYQFAGLFQSGIAALAVLVILLRRTGHLKAIVTENHLHNLGLWLFALSMFWGYIWFSQLLLIWYTNIPEETSYFLVRSHGDWWAFSIVVNPLVRLGIPFLALLPRSAKRSEYVLLRVAAVVLAGHWLDLWLQILPRALPGGPSFGFYEVGAMVGIGAAFLLVVLKALERAELVPVRDPFLEESLHHRI